MILMLMIPGKLSIWSVFLHRIEHDFSKNRRHPQDNTYEVFETMVAYGAEQLIHVPHNSGAGNPGLIHLFRRDVTDIFAAIFTIEEARTLSARFDLADDAVSFSESSLPPQSRSMKVLENLEWQKTPSNRWSILRFVASRFT
jgi:hypothetical protein